MKKRIVAILLIMGVLFSVSSLSVNAASKKSAKYVKIKKTTYQKYKKAYKENQKYLDEIFALQDDYEKIYQENANLKEELDKTKSQNSWIWNNVRSIGLSYSNKTWTIPSAIPESFIVDGVKYKVVIEN